MREKEGGERDGKGGGKSNKNMGGVKNAVVIKDNKSLSVSCNT